MPQHILKYVRRIEHEKAVRASDGLFVYAASDQYDTLKQQVGPGDVLWTVTIPLQASGRIIIGELLLVGRLIVGCMTKSGSIVLEKTGIAEQDLFRRTTYALPAMGTVEPYGDVSIADMVTAGEITFTTAPEPLVLDERIAYRLQRLRPLTAHAASLLTERWTECCGSADQDRISETAFDSLKDEGTGYTEGDVVIQLHRRRERDKRLVAHAKTTFKRRHGGRLFCEVCGFDFAQIYGLLGDGFIEAHHRVPLSELTEATLTRIADLTMVCANCHRMLHRRTPWLTVEELREIVQGRAA